MHSETNEGTFQLSLHGVLNALICACVVYDRYISEGGDDLRFVLSVFFVPCWSFQGSFQGGPRLEALSLIVLRPIIKQQSTPTLGGQCAYVVSCQRRCVYL